MNVTIVDYNSGNISSVINSFEEVAKDKVNIEVTSDLNKIKSSDKVVLPGQGSFKSCVDALNCINGLVDTLNEFVINNKKPLLGICVGLQMFADIGYEEMETKGLGWISGKVSKIDNQNDEFKLPHIGWNEINIIKDNEKSYIEFYGSSSEEANEKHYGGLADYRSSEGKKVRIEYRSSLDKTVKDILGEELEEGKSEFRLSE